jgi:hypothetical protein
VWCIGPEEGTHFTRHLHGLVDTKSLQGLHVEDAIVEIPVSALFTVNTLSLPKHLPLHDKNPFPRCTCAKNRAVNYLSGSLLN